MSSLPPTWHQTLATVIDKDFSHEAIGDLLKSLETLVESSAGMVLRYPKDRGAVITHERLLADDSKSHNVSLYEDVAYLLDPYYRAAIDRDTEGIFTIDDVAPAGFEESEYYSVYYQQAGLCDEVCYNFKDREGGMVSVSLARRVGCEKFSKHDLDTLRDIAPLIRSILLRWTDRQDSQSNNFEEHLGHALQTFGQSVLTPKECQIVGLLLHGHSMKSIAEKLDNSSETIKHHRKNVYQKLDISSQSELFYLFIDSVRNNSGHRDLDPLVNYFQS